MKLLIVTHVVRKNDGQGRVNYEVVRAALAAGHAVTILASELAPELRADARIRFVHLPISRVPTQLLQHQMFAVRSALWIGAHRNEFDVIHVNGFITWAKADVNAVHFVHAGWRKSGFYPFSAWAGGYAAYQVAYTRVNEWCEKRAFGRTRVIVPVSRKVGDEIRALGVDEARLRVIHNGVDIDEFAPGPSCRERFKLPAEPFMLLFAGDLRVSRKNLDTVLKALAMAPGHVHLVVAGILRNSPYPELVRSMGLHARVHFLDLVKDVPALMRSVDAFVFPSRYEAMSLVMLEALATGLPVITATSAGGAEVIGSECGIVLDSPEDVAGLAHAVDMLAADPARARAMGRAARELAGSLSWQTMAARYLALYEEQAAARGRPSTGMRGKPAHVQP